MGAGHFSRGFLLGEAEWLPKIPVGMIVSGKPLTQTVTQVRDWLQAIGATIGAGLVSFVYRRMSQT